MEPEFKPASRLLSELKAGKLALGVGANNSRIRWSLAIDGKSWGATKVVSLSSTSLKITTYIGRKHGSQTKAPISEGKEITINEYKGAMVKENIIDCVKFIPGRVTKSLSSPQGSNTVYENIYIFDLKIVG